MERNLMGRSDSFPFCFDPFSIYITWESHYALNKANFWCSAEHSHEENRGVKKMKRNTKFTGFTLIELLIVIAIILILIAIALPNFLEAQVRAKVANARGELKTLMVATESYKLDWKKEPIAEIPGVQREGAYSWWGFSSHGLTTPIKYISSLPSEPFSDDFTIDFWRGLRGAESDPPYTVIRASWIPYTWPIGSIVSNNSRVQAAAGGSVPISRQFHETVSRCGYIYYSSGPDRVDGTVWGNPQYYTPTNGTTSFGELYEFGPGSPDPKE
jgi:prepilin-type N-terminal cleavage/methylation domain-containing protein